MIMIFQISDWFPKPMIWAIIVKFDQIRKKLMANLLCWNFEGRKKFLRGVVGKENVTICNGNRTEWSPIRSVIIWVITKSDDYIITSMITDRIGQHKVLLQINHKNYNFRGKKIANLCDNRKIYIKNWQRMHKFKSLYTVSMVIESKLVIG